MNGTPKVPNFASLRKEGNRLVGKGMRNREKVVEKHAGAAVCLFHGGKIPLGGPSFLMAFAGLGLFFVAVRVIC